MCTNACQKYALPNRADHGRASTAAPFSSANPVGWFIQPLTEMTKSEPVTPAIAIGMPERKCNRGGSRSQPYA